jgi:hypothetical protein
MNDITLQSIGTLANTLSLTAFLLYVWYSERLERLKMRDDLIAHLKDDIDRTRRQEDGTVIPPS